MLIAKLFWAPCLGEPPFRFPFHLFRLLSVNLSPICSVFVSNLIVIWKREGSPHLVSPLLVRCVFVATNLLDQMPRMEGKHHCASPLLFPSYISNFEQLEKERAVTIVWVFFWSDGDRSYTNENHFSALLSASYFFKVWTPQVFLHRSNQIWIPQLWPQFPKLADGDTLPLAINTQTTVATSLLCLHNTTAINTVAHTASPHCGSSRRRNTNWNSFVAQITSGTLQLPICPQGGTRHH